MKNYILVAKRIVQENIYLTIATASKTGKPWISPVFFSYDDNYNLYWVSDKNSLHSKLLRNNPQASIVIFNSQAPIGKGDGVYFETIVKELEDESEIKKAVQIYNKRVTKKIFRVKEINEVMNKAIWRIYKATPTKISKLTEGKIVNGQYVDKRVELHLT